MCPELPDPLNGAVEVSGLTVGSTASYTCDDGFELSENILRMCEPGGVWSGSEPLCESGICIHLSLSLAYKRRNSMSVISMAWVVKGTPVSIIYITRMLYSCWALVETNESGVDKFSKMMFSPKEHNGWYSKCFVVQHSFLAMKENRGSSHL